MDDNKEGVGVGVDRTKLARSCYFSLGNMEFASSAESQNEGFEIQR
jgi:hypothetical protein